MMKFIKNNIVSVLSNMILLLIVISTVLVVYNRTVMVETTKKQEVIEETLVNARLILNNLQAIDLGLRAYSITKSENHLGHYKNATGETNILFDKLEKNLEERGYSIEILPDLKTAMTNYVIYCDKIITLVDLGQDSIVRERIVEDKGYDAWKLYQEFYKDLFATEKQLSIIAHEEYDKAASRTIWMMIILFFVSAPTIYYIRFLLRTAKKKRQQMFKELEKNNRKYNFDSGVTHEVVDEYQIINDNINNAKKAAQFVCKITEGEYDVQWEGMNENNLALNQTSLAGALIKMRNQMKVVKEEEEKRLWLTKGEALFSEIVRKNQDNLSSLAYESVVFLVKYLGAQLGGIYLIREDSEKVKYLELTACYAFEKKKFVKKRFEIGEGLVGQAYIEGLSIFLKEIPQNHIKIITGLGDSKPNSMVLVPMKYNGEVQAIIELASFNTFEKYQIDFLEKLGEFVASAIFNVQTNEVTKQLLVEAQHMAEEMKSQEEEMRQNMEELTATQEEMHRKEREYIERINSLEEQLLSGSASSES